MTTNAFVILYFIFFKMSCIILIGGIIGCGKTEFIKFIITNKELLFQNTLSRRNGEITNCNTLTSKDNTMNFQLATILFDELCSIKEQAELMKTLKGMRRFRSDLLEASECFICSKCNISCDLTDSISSRSKQLLQKLKSQDNNSDSMNTLFLVEDNFYYRSMRYEWLQLARRANLGFCQVFVTCSLDTAIQRNRSRNYHIPEDRIRRINSCIEYPDSSKYKWEKHSIILDSTEQFECSSIKDVIQTIERACNNPAEVMLNEEKREAQIICSKNVIHQADKIIRKLTSKKISSFKDNLENNSDLKTIVSVILNARQKLLTDLKQDATCLPEHLCQSIENLGIDSVEEEFEAVLNTLFENILLTSESKKLSL